MDGFLFLEEVEEGLAVAVLRLRGGSTTSLLLHQYLRFKERARVVDVLVRNPYRYGFHALVARRRIKVQAVAAGMQVCPAVLAFVCWLDLIHHLDLYCTVAAASDQVKSRLHPPGVAFRSRRELRSSISIGILVTALAILSGHLQSSI